MSRIDKFEGQMPDKKKKENKKTSKPDKEEETHHLVEVYGDEIRDAVKVDRKEEKDEKDEKSEDREKKEDKKKTPEEIVEEIIEERQAFKTEVVDQDDLTSKDEALEKKEEKEKDKEDKSDNKKPMNIDDTAFEEEIGSQKGSVRSVFGVGMFVFLIIFGLTGWAFYLKTVWLPGDTTSEIVVEASPTPDTSTPTPTPTPLTRDEITLDILNGSGVTGLAGKTATTFEDLGYVLGKVGNAESTKENELYIKEESLNKFGVLYEDVLEELKISSPSGYLDTDEKADARIVLGE